MPRPHPTNSLFTLGRASHYINISIHCLKDLIKQGKIQRIRGQTAVGSSIWLVPVESLRAWRWPDSKPSKRTSACKRKPTPAQIRDAEAEIRRKDREALHYLKTIRIQRIRPTSATAGERSRRGAVIPPLATTAAGERPGTNLPPRDLVREEINPEAADYA